MKKIYSLFLFFLVTMATQAQVNTLSESFNAASPAGWTAVNNSSPVGTGNWNSGSTSTSLPGYIGAGYAVVNYTAVNSVGDISAWYLSPQVNLKDGAVITFYTRTAAGTPVYPDRMEVRLSTAGASANVGTSATDVGDFTILACSVNPTLSNSATSTGGCGNPYPQAWTQYTITVSGIGTTPVAGRIGFRYWVTNGGLNGSNSNIIGIDEFSFDNTACSGTPVAGTSPANQTVCSGSTTTLAQTGVATGAGISFQWQQSSTLAGTYTDVTTGTGGTTNSYTTPALTTTTYYRLKTTCANGGGFVYGNPVTVTVTTQPSAIPMNLGFNTTSSFNECLKVATVTNGGTNGNPAIAFSAAGASVGGATDPTLNPQEGDRMIRFNSYIADAGDQMRLVLPTVNTTGTASIDIAFWYYEVNGADASTDNIQVQYTTDGTNWNTVAGTTTNITNASLSADGSQNRWVRKQFTLPGAVGNQASVTVGLLFTSGYGYHTFVDFIQLGATGTLPVTYVSFTGETINDGNSLKWTTATEINNKVFEIERSSDGKNYSTIAKVATKAENGNSTSPLSYQYTDSRPLGGTNYYRLKQVNVDGKFSYSNIVTLKTKVSDIRISSVYPNPTRNELNLVIIAPAAQRSTIIVTDLSGKIISQRSVQLNAGDNLQQFNTQQLTPGTYLVKVMCDNGCETTAQRFVKL